MSDVKKRCFVVMGFGIKTDYINGRKLDLNKSYRLLIKPVVEAKNIECVRADEITHSGSIDVQMYKELLQADLVIADLSTLNANALYELGVRHALRPYTTIVISEDKLVYPFDLNHVVIHSYQHLGDAIDYEEVERFRAALDLVIQTVLDKDEADSPVYTYLNSLIPPKLQAELERAVVDRDKSQPIPEVGKALSLIIQEAEDAIDIMEFAKARDLFHSAILLSGGNTGQKDPYLFHRLSFTTYKAAEPDLVTALNRSLSYLHSINLAHTNDPETVSSAGAVEKKLYECGQGDQHLEDSILYYQRSYYLLNNRYNGINLALTLVYHATSNLVKSDQERIADLIFARRTWKRVLFLCDRDWEIMVQKEKNDQLLINGGTKEGKELQEFYNRQKYWILVNRAESSFGLGDFETHRKSLQESNKVPFHQWQLESFTEQIGNLATELKKVGHLLEPKWIAPD
ncbi:MAG: hypothetical protein Q8S14_00635 [Algoriphagus sp.]|uniref:tetratricopeptide repeat-containing protein n=1 Tax=Algoriphagus sp. TaxID=1872435 RepID=UPI0027321974|nr:tetratricopeptide repeat-containing protein [Algoriphagus sp.]MDP2039948.1 hypothetical protein [Algoriphagus sp.]MDP3470347.1 hypothetical protein [Algoriphagus sp.]